MRASGILLPIFSLPGEYGIGCFSKEAYRFVDFLEKAGQKYWQILPLGPTSYGDSPYQSFSTFAGNPYFIDLQELVKQKLITKARIAKADFGSNETDIDYEKLYQNRFAILFEAYKKSNIAENEDFKKFCKKNVYWLEDYALFMAIKDSFGGVSFAEWPGPYPRICAAGVCAKRARWSATKRIWRSRWNSMNFCNMNSTASGQL